MKKALSLLFFFCFTLLTHRHCYAQKDGKDKVKKLNLLPVYLVPSGLPSDTSVDRIVKEGFERHKVKLINRAQFDKASDDEANRIVNIMRLRNAEFKSEREIAEAASREQKYVVNMLTIRFYIQISGDTLNVIGASWEATPFPPNLYGSVKSSGKIETELTDICCSTRDNLFAIIDKILFSKWLY